MKKNTTEKISRREFLSKGVVLGAGAIASATLPLAATAEIPEELKTEKKKEEGYRLTQHIADYYKSAAL